MAQSVQPTKTAPATLILPSGQARHVLGTISSYVPAAQLVQPEKTAPAPLILPSGQSIQCSLLVVSYVPGAQGVQLVFLTAGCTSPSIQLVQLGCPNSA